MGTPALLNYSINVTGADRIANLFSWVLPNAIETAIKEQALLRVGRKIEARAKYLCPVDTGALKESIHLTGVGTMRLSIVASGGAKGRAYALFVEYGTYKMWARPYLRPALEEYGNGSDGGLLDSVANVMFATLSTFAHSVGAAYKGGGFGTKTTHFSRNAFVKKNRDAFMHGKVVNGKFQRTDL